MVKCPNCGAENGENSKFCKICGSTLQTETQQTDTLHQQDKNPALAAILNLLVWGSGYIYLNINTILGVPSFAILGLWIVWAVLTHFLGLAVGILGTILSVVFALDAYYKGQGEAGFL
ncbi:zinc-ribbon domain-containing protein [Archaeoglobus sp.]